MRDHPVIAMAAGLVLLGSLAALAFTAQGLPLRADTAVPDEIGRALAREAAAKAIVLLRNEDVDGAGTLATIFAA